MSELEQALQQAAEALRRCLAGDDAGLALYRECARPGVAARLPLGLHAHMIEEAGRDATADALRQLAVEQGGDLAWRAAVLPDASAEATVAEYEELFARGFANAPMVSGYIVALTELGRSDEVAAIFDPERLIHCVTLEGADAVAAALLEAEAEMDYGSRQVSREMRHTLGLETSAHPAFAALMAECRAETAAYFARWAASDHPLAHLVPSSFSMRAWGMIARGEGHNTRHRHPVGWATGVYYPAGLPEGSVGGELRIGGWSDPAPPGWPQVSIRPEPGLLALIPSWYVHWTEPTQAEGPRLAIAYDAVPEV